ncbi:MAG TPA: DUF2059 domain-containing protein [Noviherbaspirillum sp.]
MIKSAIATTLIAAAGLVHAAGAPQAVSPAKQELVQRVLKLWQVEMIGEVMLQEPVVEAVAQARSMLQGRATVEKRDAAMKDISADAQKFLDDTKPLVRSQAQKHIPTTVAPILAEKFTEEELKQLVMLLESPVKKKFEDLVPDMKKALGEKLAADTRPTIDPKLEDLRNRISTRLRAAVTP